VPQTRNVEPADALSQETLLANVSSADQQKAAEPLLRLSC